MEILLLKVIMQDENKEKTYKTFPITIDVKLGEKKQSERTQGINFQLISTSGKEIKKRRKQKVLPASPVLHALISFIGIAIRMVEQQEPMGTNNGSDVSGPSKKGYLPNPF